MPERIWDPHGLISVILGYPTHPSPESYAGDDQPTDT